MRYIGEPGARLGSYLAAAGDANGDNFSDLLIGERDSSRAFLIFGKSIPLGDVTLDGGQNGYRVALQAPATITRASRGGRRGRRRLWRSAHSGWYHGVSDYGPG